LSKGEFRLGLNEFQGTLKRSLGLREEMNTKRAKWRKLADSRVYRMSGRMLNNYQEIDRIAYLGYREGTLITPRCTVHKKTFGRHLRTIS
jgi:hypothetical protein